MIWLPINALFSCACVQWVGLVFKGRCTDLLLKRHTAKRFRSSGCASISNKEMQGWKVINGWRVINTSWAISWLPQICGRNKIVAKCQLLFICGCCLSFLQCLSQRELSRKPKSSVFHNRICYKDANFRILEHF